MIAVGQRIVFEGRLLRVVHESWYRQAWLAATRRDVVGTWITAHALGCGQVTVVVAG